MIQICCSLIEKYKIEEPIERCDALKEILNKVDCSL